jgi:diadenosine tetraphosphate (Ap4A) HIT family hydrolase
VNRNQNLLGKLCIVLSRHEESVMKLTPEEWADLHGEMQWAVERLTAAFHPDHFNYVFLQNQDRHVHLHVIPRYRTMRQFEGVRFTDPDFGAHYSVDRREIVGVGFAAAMSAALNGVRDS